MFKKILAMTLSFAMVLSLAACGGGNKPAASSGSASAPADSGSVA